jgi:hypothetical protein
VRACTKIIKDFKYLNIPYLDSMIDMGIPLYTKTFKIESKIGDGLEVRIEKLGSGEQAEILYRIIRGEDRRIASSDKVVLFKSELEKIIEFLEEAFLRREFPD